MKAVKASILVAVILFASNSYAQTTVKDAQGQTVATGQTTETPSSTTTIYKDAEGQVIGTTETRKAPAPEPAVRPLARTTPVYEVPKVKKRAVRKNFTKSDQDAFQQGVSIGSGQE